MSSLIRLGAAALAVPAALVLGIALAAGATGVTTATSPPVSPACGTTPVQAGKSNNGTVLDSTQIADAEVIYSVSASLQLPQQAAVIAIATSMQESSLVNTKHGTSDSLGLFQQRPSQGWGTPAQIMDPVYASPPKTSSTPSILAPMPAGSSSPRTSSPPSPARPATAPRTTAPASPPPGLLGSRPASPCRPALPRRSSRPSPTHCAS